MRVLVAGSRGFTDAPRAYDCLDRLNTMRRITLVISGTARGADSIGADWARSRGVPVREMPADWNTHGKSAGYKRNEQMAEIADYALIFWDGVSRGTGHMIDIAERKGITMTVIEYMGALL